jgi:ankyrin repeat protein
MMTPLLFCVNRGYMEIVRQLIDMGADRNCSDKNVRHSCTLLTY